MMDGESMGSVKRMVGLGVLALVGLFLVAYLFSAVEGRGGGAYDADAYFGEDTSYVHGEYTEEGCNVAVVPIRGTLLSYASDAIAEEYGDVVGSDDIVAAIEYLEADPETEAIILAIDSGGGDGVAGEEIANALLNIEKPTVAVVRTIAASAAYWADTGADVIYASRISDVGSIGVSMSYLDDSLKSEAEGYKYIELATGKYKDVGNVGKPLTEEERELLLADLQRVHDIFVDDVARNRNMPRSEVAALADGRTFLGEDAVMLGLVDANGDLGTATADLAAYLKEEPVVCWY